MKEQPEKAGAPAPVWKIEMFMSLFGEPKRMFWVKRDDVVVAKTDSLEKAQEILALAREH